MTDTKKKGNVPKDLIVLAAELLAGLIGAVIGFSIGADSDFMIGFLSGVAGGILITLVIIVIKRKTSKRVLGEVDEREKRIKEVAGLWSFFASVILLALFTICSFAFESLMSIGSGYIAAIALAIMALFYVLISIIANLKM